MTNYPTCCLLIDVGLYKMTQLKSGSKYFLTCKGSFLQRILTFGLNAFNKQLTWYTEVMTGYQVSVLIS